METYLSLKTGVQHLNLSSWLLCCKPNLNHCKCQLQSCPSLVNTALNIGQTMKIQGPGLMNVWLTFHLQADITLKSVCWGELWLIEDAQQNGNSDTNRVHWPIKCRVLSNVEKTWGRNSQEQSPYKDLIIGGKLCPIHPLLFFLSCFYLCVFKYSIRSCSRASFEN